MFDLLTPIDVLPAIDRVRIAAGHVVQASQHAAGEDARQRHAREEKEAAERKMFRLEVENQFLKANRQLLPESSDETNI